MVVPLVTAGPHARRHVVRVGRVGPALRRGRPGLRGGPGAAGGHRDRQLASLPRAQPRGGDPRDEPAPARRCPSIPEIDVGSRYRPAGTGTEVAGDFYDIFEGDRRDWFAVVGDVSGKGAEAAAVMALARYTVRTAALGRSKPSQILQILNEALLRSETERYCTATLLRLRPRPDGLLVTVSSAGHPRPLVLRRGGEVEDVDADGTLLGLFPDATLARRRSDPRGGRGDRGLHRRRRRGASAARSSSARTGCVRCSPAPGACPRPRSPIGSCGRWRTSARSRPPTTSRSWPSAASVGPRATVRHGRARSER